MAATVAEAKEARSPAGRVLEVEGSVEDSESIRWVEALAPSVLQ